MTNSAKQTPVTGYPRLADQIGRQPELGIYRSFLALNAQDLLYMQAEIIELECQLRQSEKDDSACSEKWRPKYSEDWWFLEYAGQLEGYHDDHPAMKQRSLIQRLRPLLALYNQRLLQMTSLTTIDGPSPKALKELQRFLASRHMGPYKFTGRDAMTWGSVDEPYNRAEDLIGTVKFETEDSFSRWCLDTVMSAFFACGCHRRRKPDKVSGDILYNRDQVLKITYYITSALAPLLLVLSVAALWLVTSMAARLAIMAACTITVSACLAVFTTSTRSQVFAVTATVAAVLVVFIGSNAPAACGAASGNTNRTISTTQ